MLALALDQEQLDSALPQETLSPVMPHVLLGEDDADTRRLLAWTLRTPGFGWPSPNATRTSNGTGSTRAGDRTNANGRSDGGAIPIGT